VVDLLYLDCSVTEQERDSFLTHTANKSSTTRRILNDGLSLDVSLLG
jgi:hypothetical protein